MSLEMVLKERIEELFEIDLEARTLIRKETFGKAKGGKIAGFIERDGYRRITIDGKRYSGHLLIWFLANGGYPPLGYQIDHKNRIKDDNRISNLRLATREQNSINAGAVKNSKTGVRGVVPSKDGRFRAQIMINGKTKQIGKFNTVEEADEALTDIRKSIYGEFASARSKAAQGRHS